MNQFQIAQEECNQINQFWRDKIKVKYMKIYERRIGFNKLCDNVNK